MRNFQGIFFIETQTLGDFKICISVPLIVTFFDKNKLHNSVKVRASK